MKACVLLAIIFGGLSFTTSVNGQFFPGNYFQHEQQPPGIPPTQPHGQQNFFSPSVQPHGFSPNSQVTNPHNVPSNPSFSSFPPQGFNMPHFPDSSSLFPQNPTSNPLAINHPTSFAPQNPSSHVPNPTFTSQRPNSNFNNPQQTNPSYTGGQVPGSILPNPHQTDRLFTHPQQTSPYGSQQNNPYSPQQTRRYNPQPTALLSTVPHVINPSTLRHQSNNPDFTGSQQVKPRGLQQTIPNHQQFNPGAGPQQASPSYTSPHGTIPTSLGPHQNIPQSTNPQQFHPDPQKINPSNPNPLGTIPTSIESQLASLILSHIPEIAHPHRVHQDSRSPQQTNTGSQPINSEPTIPQHPSSDSPVPHQSSSDLIVPQHPASNSTVPQQPGSNSTASQQPSSDSSVPQQSDSDAPVPQQSVSDSIVSQQSGSDSIVPQPTDSDSTNSQKTNPTSDDVKPITSDSDLSSSVDEAPQDDSSLSTEHHPSPHGPRPRSSSTRYRPRSGKQTNVQHSGDPLRGLRIVCLFNCKHYYKSGFTPAKLEPHLCTHLNYEFAMLDPKTYEMIPGEPDLDIDQNFFEEALGLKKVNPKLKVLISLGGWSDSTKKYSELAGDPAKRKNFISKAIVFLTKHGFDGMDLAWEYPNCWQGAIGVHPADKQNFVTLLNETKTEFKKHDLILSVSVGAIKREVEAAYNVPEISKNVDYINVMTYDMHGPWESKTSHHVQFEAAPGDSDRYCNVKGGMQVWLEKGASKKKLNMGLAFYARTFQMKSSNQCGMGVPAKGPGAAGPKSKEGGILSYHEVCNFLNAGNWTEKEDKYAGFYACSGDQWAGYDPPMMMVRKAKYVVESGLGGVLLKDLSGDDSRGECFNMPFPLLKMVRLELIHKVRQRYS